MARARNRDGEQEAGAPTAKGRTSQRDGARRIVRPWA
jgi:hypothetical protein